MDSQILDYIILALIFILAINLISRLFNKSNKNEQMEQTMKIQTVGSIESSNGVPQPMLESIQPKLPKDEISFAHIDLSNSIEESSIQTNIIKPQSESNSSIQTNIINEIGPISEISEISELNKIQNFTDNKPSTKKFTAEEIMQYHDAMFDFNESVNISSGGFDMVDKINELYTSGNNEISEIKGKSIAEVYDGLTQGIIDRKKNCVNKDCLIPPITDNITKTQSYLLDTETGKYFRHGLKYEDDNVETGSKFFGNVEASDSEHETYLAY